MAAWRKEKGLPEPSPMHRSESTNQTNEIVPESSGTDDGNDEYREIFNVMEQIEEDHSWIFEESVE